MTNKKTIENKFSLIGKETWLIVGFFYGLYGWWMSSWCFFGGPSCEGELLMDLIEKRVGIFFIPSIITGKIFGFFNVIVWILPAIIANRRIKKKS